MSAEPAQPSNQDHGLNPPIGTAKAPGSAHIVALGILGVLLLFAFRMVRKVGSDLGSNLEGVEEVLFEPTGSSPILIIVLSAWMFTRRWGRFRQNWGRGARPLSSLGFLIPASALGAWAYEVSAPSLLLPAAVLAILGTALACAGIAGLRVTALPALFLLFAVPIPPVLLNQVMYPVQLSVAETVGAGMNALGLSSMVFAERVYFDGRAFQVIESCSGFRSLQTLIMASVLYVELFPGPRRRNLLLVLCAIPIAWFSNQIRIATIVLNPLSHFAAVHTTQGIVTIVLGVLLIAAADWVLIRGLGAEKAKKRRRLPPRTDTRFWFGVAAAGLAAGVVACVSLLAPHEEPKISGPPIASFPPSQNGWRTEGLPLDREFLGSFRFSEWVHRRYSKEDMAVEFFAGTDNREWYGYSLYGLKPAVPGSGWRVHPLADGGHNGLRYQRFFAVSANGERKLVFRWSTGIESLPREIVYTLGGVDRSSYGRSSRAMVVRLSTVIPRHPQGSQRAEGTLRQFLIDFGGAIELLEESK